MIHLEQVHLLLEHLAILGDGDTLIFRISGAAVGVDCRAQEICHRNARDGDRVLECQEDAQAGAHIRLQLEDILALEPRLASGHFVVRVTHQCISQGGLARAVRTHQGVNFTLVDIQVNTLENFFTINAHVHIADG